MLDGAPFLTATRIRTPKPSDWDTGIQSTSRACLWGVGGTESPEKTRRGGENSPAPPTGAQATSQAFLPHQRDNATTLFEEVT